jgi:hypothetical protein
MRWKRRRRLRAQKKIGLLEHGRVSPQAAQAAPAKVTP